MRLFEPFFRNPHAATIAGNFWKRPESELRWPVKATIYSTEPGVKVLVHSQEIAQPRGEIILVHGLEGSSNAGYARSMAHAGLERGYSIHRFNMRGCGGTEELAVSSYHAGQTGDLLAVLKERRRLTGVPLFVVGFSLGGNVSLKLAGELGENATGLLAGVCAISTPIDLHACARALAEPRNFIYQRRFLNRLKERIQRRHIQAPEMYTLEHLPKVRTIEDFDDYYTAKLFGFGTAANYFRTQSSNQFLESIRIPTLLIQAKDDPLIPYSVYNLPVFARNLNLKLLGVEHGGHLGFIARRNPRFWVDGIVLDWVDTSINA